MVLDEHRLLSHVCVLSLCKCAMYTGMHMEVVRLHDASTRLSALASSAAHASYRKHACSHCCVLRVSFFPAPLLLVSICPAQRACDKVAQCWLGLGRQAALQQSGDRLHVATLRDNYCVLSLLNVSCFHPDATPLC